MDLNFYAFEACATLSPGAKRGGDKMHAEKHTPKEKKNFLPKHSSLRDEAMSFVSFRFAFSLYEGLVPTLERIPSLTLWSGKCPGFG